ncbi:xanthine dehydrogenase family protein molybdopterin-binding subunit (plasmid) [Leisingera sp. M527]|uniref:xanthine dehydrogenase family protein molybdopterin-binding subunit n=1 Tax=Leisingera sp. M527 TaxID=2867014 RepID=UPI0021A2647D|nr:xanthine dehydrogenase family protein molybdopterin-binding subunit [Leisingera sp. M527]UWQ35439.1 xanthine dehydrogenase family protein molybdopterin-binding subunit [Leisingera sp. M527]
MTVGTPIGSPMPRSDLKRLLSGRGRYTDDIKLPRMLHVTYLRSPYAHATIDAIQTGEAATSPGVEAVFTGADLAKICTPWVGDAAHRPNLKSAPQYPMAVERVTWQGEPVVAIVAETRAQAEDAAELVEIDWTPLTPLTDPEAALADGAEIMHESLGTNLVDEQVIRSGDPEDAFAQADHVVENQFRFNRQTGVTLEPRTVIANFEPQTEQLDVFQSHQSPFQMQDVYAVHLPVPEQNIRVICPDVGGAFGVKLHVYGDEVATVAISVLMGRAVKFCADRLESFVSDTHARDHIVNARMALKDDGTILAFEVDDLSAVGPYSHYRRFSNVEGLQTIVSAGACYQFQNYYGRTRIAFQNKTMVGMYRGVGLPLACAVGEQMIDHAAAALNRDPVDFRKQNYIADEMYPHTSASGVNFERLSLLACLDKLTEMMDYEGLRAKQARLRDKGTYLGIGISTFIEQTAYGAMYYGPTDARVSVQEGCTVRLEPSGKIKVLTSATEQGQGTTFAIGQIVAETLGVTTDDLRVLHGDSSTSPYGGGSWASRGLAMAGEAALDAASALRQNILEIASVMGDVPAEDLLLKDGMVQARSGNFSLSLADIGNEGHFRQDRLPPEFQPQLNVTKSNVPPRNQTPYSVANGVMGTLLKLDPDTGMIELLEHWVVDDCGRAVNPLLVDEQLRGGIVQGFGAALYEQCHYDDEGQMLNATMADYLVPMASEMPDIHVGHVETPTALGKLGAKGVGEAGTIGAVGAVWCAVNDALRPLGTQANQQPFSPLVILDALARPRS